MKKYLLISLVVIIVIPAILSAKVTFFTEDEYKRLKKKERLAYWEVLENELVMLQQRKADAIASQEECTIKKQNLLDESAALDNEYKNVNNEILVMLNVPQDDLSNINDKIETYNQEISNWETMSDKDLWKAKKSVHELVADYKEYRTYNETKVPEYREEFSDLDNKIANLERTLANAKPKYYEDTYTVVKGDWLSKIAGYSFIYNDVSKWPIIFRANRDNIKDPNLIYPDQVIKIPRGLPNDWKVYKGECLWKIASYPEVYNNAAKWPLIYRANKDRIKNPDLIYPNQIFELPRN